MHLYFSDIERPNDSNLTESKDTHLSTDRVKCLHIELHKY